MRIPRSPEIRALIFGGGLSVTDLAEEIGHNRQYVSSIISGKQRCRPENQVCAKIAESLGAQIDDIFPIVDLNSAA